MKLKTSRQEKWIEIKGEDNESASFLVKPMNPKETTQLLGTASKVDWDRGQRFKDPDYYKFKIDKIDKTIIDWRDIEDEDGKPLECNRKNKEMVFLNNPDLIDKVLEMADDLTKTAQALIGEEVKN